MHNELKIEVTGDNKVKLHITRVTDYGRTKKTSVATFSKRTFEKAMADAWVAIPWKDLSELKRASK